MKTESWFGVIWRVERKEGAGGRAEVCCCAAIYQSELAPYQALRINPTPMFCKFIMQFIINWQPQEFIFILFLLIRNLPSQKMLVVFCTYFGRQSRGGCPLYGQFQAHLVVALPCSPSYSLRLVD